MSSYKDLLFKLRDLQNELDKEKARLEAEKLLIRYLKNIIPDKYYDDIAYEFERIIEWDKITIGTFFCDV